MAGNDWLGPRRSEVAADRILDAAGELFTARSPGSVGMHEIAAAAGCSRATLYRYFENRDALHTAYVHREAQHLYARMTDCIAEIADPRERLIAGFLTSLELVRQSPALSSWFATSASPIGVEIAENSEVIQAMGSAFIVSLGADDPAVVQRKARWLVRVLTSLLLLPGRDAADERAMVEEFVVPIMAPAHTVSRNSSPG